MFRSHNNHGLVHSYPHFTDEEMKACRDQGAGPGFNQICLISVWAVSQSDKMANATIPEWARDFSQTTPNGFGTQNKHNVQNFFIQESSLLLDRTFLWKSAKDSEA